MNATNSRIGTTIRANMTANSNIANIATMQSQNWLLAINILSI
jgi:hypothetical protein